MKIAKTGLSMQKTVDTTEHNTCIDADKLLDLKMG